MLFINLDMVYQIHVHVGESQNKTYGERLDLKMHNLLSSTVCNMKVSIT